MAELSSSPYVRRGSRRSDSMKGKKNHSRAACSCSLLHHRARVPRPRKDLVPTARFGASLQLSVRASDAVADDGFVRWKWNPRMCASYHDKHGDPLLIYRWPAMPNLHYTRASKLLLVLVQSGFRADASVACRAVSCLSLPAPLLGHPHTQSPRQVAHRVVPIVTAVIETPPVATATATATARGEEILAELP